MKRVQFLILSLLTVLACLGLLLLTGCQKDKTTSVQVHYLGHASFILGFDNGLTVLTDYGTSNAWGLDSPIYEFGNFQPTVRSYSHTTHEDHFRGDLTSLPGHVLADSARLDLNELKIRPIPTCEREIYKPDNNSNLFCYQGINIVHLGDAQAYIRHVDSLVVQNKLREIYPQQIDLLFLPIQGIHRFIPEAERFIRLLNPKCVVPMHYWSPAYKTEFLNHLETQNVGADSIFAIEAQDGPQVHVKFEGDREKLIRVISLDPAPFTGFLE